MLRVDHILVPLDLHENAEPVVAWAAFMARTLHSALTLLHVNESLELLKRRPIASPEPSLGGGDDLDAWRRTYLQTAQTELASLASRYCSDLFVSSEILEGRAHVAILDYLGKNEHDLVVMGTHGRPWYQRLM